MPLQISPTRLNHMNIVMEDFDLSVQHLEERFEAIFYADLPQKEWHACVIGIGRVLFELFVPYDFLVSARLGPHHVGMEYEADMDQVRAAVEARGIRLVRDIGLAVHTHPADCHGLALEFYGDHFHDAEARTGWAPMKPPEYWRDEHPLGLTGLKGCTIGLDNEQSVEFFFDLFAGEVVYEENRASLGAKAIGYRVADAILELLIPDRDSPLHYEVLRSGEGIRSTVFGVRDIKQAEEYLIGRGLPLVPGTAPGSLAVPANANRGVVFEFSE